MPGLFGAVAFDETPLPPHRFEVRASDRISVNQILGPGYWVTQQALKVFPGDKPCTRAGGLVFCADGVVLNLRRLCREHQAPTYHDLMKGFIRSMDVGFFRAFRGSFCGALRHPGTGGWLLFSDQLGTKPLFYHWEEGRRLFLFGSELRQLAEVMRSYGLPTRLSEEGARCILGFGYMLGDHTLVEGVKRLPPGTVLTCTRQGVTLQQYYQITNEPRPACDPKVLTEGLHERFREAVRAEIEKDAEGGYRHIAQLSGGLDSRLALLYGLDAGVRRPLAITCSTSGYDDQLIAQKIAQQNNCEFLFYSLDNGDYLADILEPAVPGDGMVYFTGSAHILAMLKHLNFDGYGMMHTGMLGDGIMGGGLRRRAPARNPSIGASSPGHAHLADELARSVAAQYPNDELYLINNRYINGVMNGFRTIQGFTEVISPFLYPEFLEYALSIPASLRHHEKLYLRWISELHPLAASYRWERTGFKPRLSRLLMNLGRYHPRNVVRGLRRRALGQRRLDSMNPFEYWHQHNPVIDLAWARYFDQGLAWLETQGPLGQVARGMFQEDMNARATVLTLIAAGEILGLETFGPAPVRREEEEYAGATP